jgi:hypothetical protein
MTSLDPELIGERTEPFDVTVAAQGAATITNITLMIAPAPGGSVDRAQETALGSRADVSTATFRVDPTTLSSGYPIVDDAIGNQLRPDDTFSIDTEADADYLCLFDPGARVPVRQLIVPGEPIPGFEAATMRTHLGEAIAASGARDPNAQLVEIRGDGVQADGFIALDDMAAGSGRWWQYTFFNFTDDRRVEVTWYSVADTSKQNPTIEVTEMDPFGFSYEPIMNVPGLADSDAVMAVFVARPLCNMPTGNTNDIVRYESDLPFTMADVVRVDVGNDAWKGTAVPPVTEIWACE